MKISHCLFFLVSVCICVLRFQGKKELLIELNYFSYPRLFAKLIYFLFTINLTKLCIQKKNLPDIFHIFLVMHFPGKNKKIFA